MAKTGATPMNIYLARHTEPVSSDDQWRFLGHSDPPLSPRGIERARELASQLVAVHFDTVCSSDLTRCLQTARLVAGSEHPDRDPGGISVRPDTRLREIDTGLWEGLTREQSAERYPDEYEARERDLYRHPFPGGESFADVRARALPAFFDAALTGDETTLVVTHKGVIRVLLSEFLGLQPDQLFSLSQGYGCVNLVQVSRRPDGYLKIEGVHPDISLT